MQYSCSPLIGGGSIPTYQSTHICTSFGPSRLHVTHVANGPSTSNILAHLVDPGTNQLCQLKSLPRYHLKSLVSWCKWLQLECTNFRLSMVPVHSSKSGQVMEYVDRSWGPTLLAWWRPGHCHAWCPGARPWDDGEQSLKMHGHVSKLGPLKTIGFPLASSNHFQGIVSVRSFADIHNDWQAPTIHDLTVQ